MVAARSGVRRPALLCLVALALGPAWAAVLGLASRIVFALDLPLIHVLMFLPGLGLFGWNALALGLASAMIAWHLRDRIAVARGEPAWRVAATGVLLGAPVGAWCLATLLTLRNVQEEGWASLLVLAMAAWLGPILGWTVALVSMPLSLPLAWLSVLLLRVASGGPAGIVDAPTTTQHAS